ncbi:zinc finger and BTB domain-containing protein 1 [Ambystoma mexicanum]|uniref:zinc finger and BTB domain-containing protein 1 n=1 Tax=Ambystoma mexicanum TaxID=8296 RepID=UPI0037E93CCA
MSRPDHSSYVLQQLNNQREWGFLCDCCIAIDDIYFQAHKAVLAACSSYFRMFFMNHQHTAAPLKLSNMKINAECFDLILQFMYLGKITTAPTNVEQLKVAVNYLQLYNLPECLEDTKDNDFPSAKNSSFPSSIHESKMVFGVKMYEEPLTRNGEEPVGHCPEASSSINVFQDKDTKKDITLAGSRSHESLLEVCKKGTVTKLSNSKERVARRFGRSYTCDSCGFVFSCEKLLGEHALTCTNRHSYQKSKSYSSEDNDSNEKDLSNAKLSPKRTETFKVEAGQCLENSSSEPATVGNSSITAGLPSINSCDDSNGIIIKVETEDDAAVEMEDIKIIKISDKDFIESSENDELDDETDEPLCTYYVEESADGNQSAEHILKAQPCMNPHPRRKNCVKSERYVTPAKSTVQDATEHKVCELCGVRTTEGDISSHYLAKHIENICACGKCGQILVKGRQLQEHAERCGEPQDPAVNGFENAEEKADFAEAREETSNMMLVDMLDDLPDEHFQQNNLTDKHKQAACPYGCPNCGQRFETESLVLEHMSHCLEQDLFKNAIMEENDNDHRRKHFCNLCGKGFFQRCHLREHFTVHTKEKQFVCQTCGKQFLRERQLRLHNDMHKGMARYVCSVCDQGNFRKHDHVRHMICHLSVGETMCQVCFQIFQTNDLLEKHMDVHLYTCGVCGAKFNLRKDMRSHYNAKHFKRT